MWRFFISMIFVMLPYHVVHGAPEYDITEQREIASALQSDAALIHSRDLQKIRDFINKEDSKFINNISTLSEDEQMSLMRSWLAKRTFKFYYDKYMSEIKAKSEATGRKIKTDVYKSDEKSHNITNKNYWLDRGALDSKECERDMAKRRACDYPDGFEEYSISYGITVSKGKNTVLEELVIDKDDIAANSRKIIHISLTAVNTKASNAQELSFAVSAGGTTEKYDERHKYRNQEAADIRAGKYVQCGQNCVTSDSSRKWDSNNLLPDAAVVDLTVDYTSMKNKE